MYARNNASPRPITIGAVVQISDGAVQTTGVSVKVRKDAGSWATGAGTLAVEEGIWSYTPTQGETDCEALQILIFKTGCIPQSQQVVTTSSSSFGHAGTDQSKIANASSTVNLSGTTIKTATDIEVDTQDIQNRLPSGLVDGRMASIAEVVGDKTGYKLASDGLSLVTSWAVGITGNITGNLSGSVGSVTGNVGGNVTGSVGSISGVAFPTNFAALGINSSGHVSRVVLVDTTTTNTDMRGTDGAALATHWTSTRAGYLDGVLIAANYNQRTVQVTGSNHVAADIHELQPAVIASTHFAPGAIDANALAASAATEVATSVGTLQVLTDLVTMIVNDGTANARFSTSALQNAPSGGGGGGTGTGARTVAITVTLSAAPVEGASVRLTKAAETYVGSTNASGQITFNVDDGTWTVSITSPNATFAGASLVVDDDETVSYSLTAISITPSPAGQMTGYWTCYSHLGVVESGVSVTMQLVDVPKGSKGLALDSRLRTVTANGSGVAQFTNLFPGCRYKVYRGAADNKAFYVTLPEVAPADPVELGSFYGDDE